MTKCAPLGTVFSSQRLLAIIGIVTGLLVGVLAWVSDGAGWPALESPPRQGEALDPSAYAQRRIEHALTVRARLVREPQNTWSNLAFVAVGAGLLARRSRPWSHLAGMALLAVGVGSFLYHASASRVLRHADVGAMYALFIVLGLVALTVARPRLATWLTPHLTTTAIVISLIAVALTLGRNWTLFGSKPLNLSLATGLCATLTIGALLHALRRDWSARRGRLTAGAIGCFALALLCQLGDRPGGWLCQPGGPIQAHALWHVLSAAAVGSTLLALNPIPDVAPKTTSKT